MMIAMAIAGTICMILPTEDFSRLEKAIVFLAAWFLIYSFSDMNSWETEEEQSDREDRRQQFHIMLRRTTLPGKYHTIDIRTTSDRKEANG